MSLDILFNALSLIYLFRGITVANTVRQRWAELKQATSLTAEQKGLIDQAAFYLAVPVGVFVHESGHALAILLFGGRVVEFGYRFFWGYVLPAGTFTPAENWFIAIAGTLGSLAFGLLVWLLTRRRAISSLIHFGLDVLRYQIYFSLIIYPLFTLLSLFGDWRFIYDFRATPLLSGLTAVAHVGLLARFWQARQRGWFEGGLTAALPKPTSEADGNFSTGSQLDLDQIRALRQAGATNQAIHQLKTYLQANPYSGEGYLLMSLLQGQQSRMPPAVAENAQKALDLGLPNKGLEALAHQMIGQYRLYRERVDEAIQHYSQGLEAEQGTEQPLRQAQLRYLRAIAYRRKRQFEAAYEDIQQAIRLAQEHKLEEYQPHYQAELEAIKRHAGRPLGPTATGLEN